MLCLEANVSGFVTPACTVLPRAPAGVRTGIIGVYIERWRLHAGVRAPASHAWLVTRSRTRAAPDLAVNSAAPAIHTYHLPNAPPVVSLNARRRETPRNAQSQQGARMLGALRSGEGGGRRPGRHSRSPSGTGRGQEGVWRQGEGVQVGVKLVLVSVETTTIKNGCRSQCC